MREYQKIETLYKFDNVTKTYRKEFFNPYVDYLKDNEWIASEKIDGTNVQVEYDGHRVAFHGRTERTNFPKEVLAALTEKVAGSEVVVEQMFGDLFRNFQQVTFFDFNDNALALMIVNSDRRYAHQSLLPCRSFFAVRA